MALLRVMPNGDGRYQDSVAFTIRSTKSGQICGLILALLDWDTFDVSIVYDLDDEGFRDRDFFDRWLESCEALEPQDLTRDVISYKLKDGTYLFLGCDGQDILCGSGSREMGQMTMGRIPQEDPSVLELLELPERLKLSRKAQLRVGIVQ
jgi:hypothetical protein